MHVNDKKLKFQTKKCIFFWNAFGVKGYRLCCSNSKFLKYIISRDVTFNEFSILSSKKESFSSCQVYDSMQKQIKFEIGSSSLSIQQVSIDTSKSTDENNSEKEE